MATAATSGNHPSTSASIDGLRDKGFDTVGEVSDFEGIYRLCYVRGRGGLIVELAERIASDGAS
jgi:hypothetical protein